MVTGTFEHHDQKAIFFVDFTDVCFYFSPPPAAQYQEGNLNCSTTTYEEPSKYSYYDNERIMIKASSYYTAFKGFLNFKENTPKYCFSNSNQGQLLDSFDIHFKRYN